jgi:hypothetical protein
MNLFGLATDAKSLLVQSFFFAHDRGKSPPRLDPAHAVDYFSEKLLQKNEAGGEGKCLS